MGQIAPDGVEELLGVALAGGVADLLGAALGTPASEARYRPSERLSMLAISVASLSVMAVSGLRSDVDRSWISPQSVLSPRKALSSEDENWSLTVTVGHMRTAKIAGQRLF
jgi:hypothetical protein